MVSFSVVDRLFRFPAKQELALIVHRHQERAPADKK
jgi:hypothetical protein